MLTGMTVAAEHGASQAVRSSTGSSSALSYKVSAEPVDEPPKRLAEARTELGVSNADFGVCAIGETRAFAVNP